jgi:hypothetical protein
MVLRLGTNARRTGTGGHRVFAGSPGTQMVKTSGRDGLTWLRDHEAPRPGSITTRPATQATTASPWALPAARPPRDCRARSRPGICTLGSPRAPAAPARDLPRHDRRRSQRP